MKSLLAILTLSLLLFNCSDTNDDTVETQPFEYQNISISEKLKLAITSDYIKGLGYDDETYAYLNEYYNKRNHQPRWVNDSMLTDVGGRLKNVMKNNFVLGIPHHRINYGNSDNYIQDEIQITVSLARTINDLETGIIDFETKKKRPVQFTDIAKLDDFQALEDDDIRDQFIKFGPEDSTYSVLCKGLAQLIDNYPMDTSTYEIRSIKYDTLSAVEGTWKALISKGYLAEDVIDTTGMAQALQTFQIDNGLKPDGIIGKYTSKSLNESTYNKVQRIILAMDKIRGQRTYPDKYIRINIPEYKLRFYINDSLKSAHNIVVGKYENQTPELEAKLRRIIVYPYWNVPYSISSKELLPSIKYDSGYLAKHDYKLYRNGEEVDPIGVDWKGIRRNAFPFKIVQQPGPGNAMGIIKFDFYNKHSVYFHDTPSKGLFSADVRAFSHGCMRTQFPVALAKEIIKRDKIGKKRNDIIVDSLDNMLGRAEHQQIRLVDPIPIYVDYVTVVREKERMVVYLDIYGRDKEYIQIMHE
ncbi:MAG: L,D-transpeptidase family protein [Crocinitomicaceae bacterium]|nr:L,D-transpeptidase family protein [Crocinitomicaceae bacterium]